MVWVLFLLVTLPLPWATEPIQFRTRALAERVRACFLGRAGVQGRSGAGRGLTGHGPVVWRCCGTCGA